MTKNERLILIQMAKISGNLLRALSVALPNLPPGPERDTYRTNIEDAMKAFQKTAELMDKAWIADEQC